MGKKVFGLLLSVVLLAGMVAWAEGEMDRSNVSIKAGPTEAGEGISIVWVEASVYPKTVKGDKTLSLGVRLASTVKSVTASFDFSSDKVSLGSSNRMSWSNVYNLPKDLSAGVHMVRYQISSERGNVQRTVEFFVEGDAQLAKKEVAPLSKETVANWPLTVTSSCSVLTNKGVRYLAAGQKLTGLSKLAGYQVLFNDGQEGWMPSTRVSDPTADYLKAGYTAYAARDYAGAIKAYSAVLTIDPDSARAYFWIGKAHAALGETDAAVDALIKASRLDDRDMEIRVMSASLAQQYFKVAHVLFKEKAYDQAIKNFRRVVELKPGSVLSWIEMGQGLKELGFENEARDAWKEALKYDPENRELHALLKTNYVASSPDAGSGDNLVGVQASSSIPTSMAGDSLSLVKEEKTKKGMRVETAIRSVITMTKSLGTPIVEKGWQIKKQGEKILVSYLCEQNGGILESFDWLVDVDTRSILPQNENARLLMSRW
jgi:tetratricopeptide (TPR) repeat protein